jgi:hypothetical protein
VISAREFLQLWQIWPRVMDLLFSVLDREITCQSRMYTSFSRNSRVCMQVSLETVAYVCRSQWR